MFALDKKLHCQNQTEILEDLNEADPIGETIVKGQPSYLLSLPLLILSVV